MPLKHDDRDAIHLYCTNDLEGDLQWYVDQFDFIDDLELRKRLGRAFYSARYVYKLMEAMFASGDEVHAFVKFQIIQYASIYEAVISTLLWGRFKNDPEVQNLETHMAFRAVPALGHLTSIKYDDEQIHTCVKRKTKTPRTSIAFGDKVDCAVRIGFVESTYSDEIKTLFKLRNLTHIENEAEKQIEVDIQQAKTGYWRMKPFLEHIRETLVEKAE